MVLQGTIYESFTGGSNPSKQYFIDACAGDPECIRDVNHQYPTAPPAPAVDRSFDVSGLRNEINQLRSQIQSNQRESRFDNYVPPLLSSMIRTRNHLLTDRILQSEMEDRVRKNLETKQLEKTKEIIEKEIQEGIKKALAKKRTSSKKRSSSRSRKPSKTRSKSKKKSKS